MDHRQRTRAKKLNEQGFTPEWIAKELDLPLTKVRGAVRKSAGRPRTRPRCSETGRVLVSDLQHAKKALGDALRLTTVSGRFKKVKCVLANYGPLLGLTMDDAPKVIADFVAKKQKRDQLREQQP